MNADSSTWVETWLSAPRFSVYLAAAGGSTAQAVALYEWNARVAAALHRDLAHVEIGLRNAYDRALTHAAQPGQVHWVFEPERHFPVELQRAANGRTVDANVKPRKQLAAAVAAARGRDGHRRTPAPPPVPPGKVVAELSFGFWRYLSSRRHHDSLWIPVLHTAFPRGTDRKRVDGPVGRLHDLRNRVAHHEPLLRTNLDDRHQDVLTLAGLLVPELAEHLARTSSLPELLAARPR